MASSYNLKSVHRDGKSELKIGIDKTAKIIEGTEKELHIKNADGTNAVISRENIPCIPSNASEKNKLVTQEDLKAMLENITDIIESANALAKIVGGLDDED